MKDASNTFKNLKSHFNKFQLFLLFTLLFLNILTPIIGLFIPAEYKQTWLTIEVGILTTFSILLCRLFILNNSKQENSDSTENNIYIPPKIFENYLQAQSTIKQNVRDFLNDNKDVHIQIMGVAMQFSWKILIEDALPDLLEVGNRKQKITVDLYVVQPKHLLKWNQKDLVKYSEICVNCTPEILSDFRKNHENDRISINVFQYDNIPHRHGILVNNSILFRSMCSFNDNEKLQVGQNYYKMFKIGEHQEAIDNIALFNNWAEMYRKRHSIITKEKDPVNVT